MTCPSNPSVALGDGTSHLAHRDGPCRLSAVYSPLSCMVIPVEDTITGNSAFPPTDNMRHTCHRTVCCFSFPFKNWNITDMQCAGSFRWWCSQQDLAEARGLHSMPWLMKYRRALCWVCLLGGFLFCFLAFALWEKLTSVYSCVFKAGDHRPHHPDLLEKQLWLSCSFSFALFLSSCVRNTETVFPPNGKSHPLVVITQPAVSWPQPLRDLDGAVLTL